MRIVSALAPGSISLGRRIAEISHEADKRLRWFDYYEGGGGRNARKTCRHFGISPDTFYRWKRCYRPDDLNSLEDHSHRPKHVRQPTWTPETARAVLELREQYPGWGKEKLAVLLERRGIKVSVSMVGRILKSLKARGVLREPIRNHISARKRLQKRPYAVRKPKEYAAKAPGDIVEVDTMDVRPLPGVIINGLPVGCGRAVKPGHSAGGGSLHRQHPGAHAVPGQGDPGGRWLRVPECL